MIYSWKEIGNNLDSNQANKSNLIRSGQEDLINELITNINGKLNLKTKSFHPSLKEMHLHVPSPYSKSLANDDSDHHILNYSHAFNLKDQNTNQNMDPYSMMQKLLKEGSLIKEAVRRLQFNQNESIPF